MMSLKRAVAALLTLVAVLAAGSCSTFTEAPIVVQAQFGGSTGLYEGNNVAILGINVGTVTDIRPQGTHVVATLELDPGTTVPHDVVAAMVSPSVVTDRHIELTPPYKKGAKLRSGDIIPIDRTRTPVEIDRVIAVADRLAAELAKTDGSGKGVVRDSFDVLASNLKGNGAKIRTSITALSKAIGAVTEDRDALTGLIKNLSSLTKAAAANDKTIRSFSSNVTEITELFAENSPEFTALLKQLNSLLKQTETVLTENRASVRQILKRAKVTTETLNENGRELVELVDVMPLMFQNFTQVISPKLGAARVHANADDILVDGQLLDLLCGRLGVRLPGCQTGKLGDFGPDLGITEMLLGVVK